MTIDLVVFDCDGVLVDSEFIAAEVEMAHLHALGWPIDAAAFRARFTGVPTEDILMIGARHMGVEPDPDFIAAARAELRRRMQSVQPVAGALDCVHGVGADIAVASNSHRVSLDTKLAACGLTAAFSGRSHAYEDVVNPKPAPDLYLRACAHAGHRPDRAIAVEDSVTGIRAARAAGLRVIGFTGASHLTSEAGAELVAAGAEQVVDSMAALAQLLPRRR